MKKAVRQLPVPKGTSGRPAKLEKDIARRTQEYLGQCIDIFSAKGKAKQVNLPSVERFARYLGVHRDTLYARARENLEYEQALETIKLEQRERLINNGLAGTYNPSITKLILAVNHGMREQKDSRDDYKMIGIVKRIYERADEIEQEERQKGGERKRTGYSLVASQPLVAQCH